MYPVYHLQISNVTVNTISGRVLTNVHNLYVSRKLISKVISYDFNNDHLTVCSCTKSVLGWDVIQIELCMLVETDNVSKTVLSCDWSGLTVYVLYIKKVHMLHIQRWTATHHCCLSGFSCFLLSNTTVSPQLDTDRERDRKIKLDQQQQNYKCPSVYDSWAQSAP